MGHEDQPRDEHGRWAGSLSSWAARGEQLREGLAARRENAVAAGRQFGVSASQKQDVIMRGARINERKAELREQLARLADKQQAHVDLREAATRDLHSARASANSTLAAVDEKRDAIREHDAARPLDPPAAPSPMNVAPAVPPAGPSATRSPIQAEAMRSFPERALPRVGESNLRRDSRNEAQRLSDIAHQTGRPQDHLAAAQAAKNAAVFATTGGASRGQAGAENRRIAEQSVVMAAVHTARADGVDPNPNYTARARAEVARAAALPRVEVRSGRGAAATAATGSPAAPTPAAVAPAVAHPANVVTAPVGGARAALEAQAPSRDNPALPIEQRRSIVANEALRAAGLQTIRERSPGQAYPVNEIQSVGYTPTTDRQQVVHEALTRAGLPGIPGRMTTAERAAHEERERVERPAREQREREERAERDRVANLRGAEREAAQRQQNDRDIAGFFPGGTHNTASFEAAYSPGNGVTAKMTSCYISRGSASMSFQLKNAAGQDVGHMSREYTKHPDGSLTLYHASFGVPREHQGSGIGAGVMRSSILFNKSIGVKSIGVTAGSPGNTGGTYESWKQNLDKIKENKAAKDAGLPPPHPERSIVRPSGMIGSYMWATTGFGWASSHDKETSIADFSRYLKNEHGLSESAAKEHAKEACKHPWILAKATLNGKKVGHHFLTARTNFMWHGKIGLNPPDKSYAAVKAKLGLPE